ncbi:hypothetical protein P154DRAFT_612071 [Amniculicola lignicola CBS 123094]|uniref:Chlorophyllase n=1 Tax=Amniculicola lignicola CBS 123094 TaxID=1392246 RepID=A0A6A5W0A3_9PLEO|nr:hypothetical protein P154DRAFT_612071 [Amniculicola lignicola CBS 123094]
MVQFYTFLLLVLAPLFPTSALAQTFKPDPGNFPVKGDGDFAGGIFSLSLSDLGKYTTGGSGPTPEAPSGAGTKTSGSGPYPARMLTDSTLPGHTIFAPKAIPAGNLSMPFIAWGNGACTLNSGTYENLLVEIASYGYVIAADGTPTGSSGTSSQSKVQDMRDSLDWAFAGKAAKYGNIDLTKVTTAGHSCGGLEAMSTAYHDARVKRIMMFNIAIFQDDRRYLLAEIKVPVAYLIGGKTDMGYSTSAKDYALLNAGLPKLRVNLETGHGGTFSATNGGKQGKAAVNYLEWQWRDNATAKAYILNGGLVKDNWVVEQANW